MMNERAPLTSADRASRIRTALVMGLYDPAGARANALIEALVDLICLARASNWPFEPALERARQVTGQAAPAPAFTDDAPMPGVAESWGSCGRCQRLHPQWAVCLDMAVGPPGVAATSGQLVRVVHDPSGRHAAHVEAWYGRLPGVLARAEVQMHDADSTGGDAQPHDHDRTVHS